MFIPLIVAILAATLYALTNHIDKYLISKVVKNADSRSLIVFSTLVAGFAMSIIYAFICGFQFEIDLKSFLLLLFNSTLYVFSLFYKELKPHFHPQLHVLCLNQDYIFRNTLP